MNGIATVALGRVARPGLGVGVGVGVGVGRAMGAGAGPAPGWAPGRSRARRAVRRTQRRSRRYWQLAQYPGHHTWRGLRCTSRLDSDWECWAVWEPSPLREGVADVVPVTRTHPALHGAAARGPDEHGAGAAAPPSACPSRSLRSSCVEYAGDGRRPYFVPG